MACGVFAYALFSSAMPAFQAPSGEGAAAIRKTFVAVKDRAARMRIATFRRKTAGESKACLPIGKLPCRDWLHGNSVGALIPGMKAAREPWIFRTYAGHSSAAASNALYRSNLAKGQTGLSIAFDLPTQTGYDSDHPMARGEVGKVGVPVNHL